MPTEIPHAPAQRPFAPTKSVVAGLVLLAGLVAAVSTASASRTTPDANVVAIDMPVDLLLAGSP